MSAFSAKETSVQDVVETTEDWQEESSLQITKLSAAMMLTLQRHAT